LEILGAMSAENVEVVRRFYEVWNSPEPRDALLPLVSEDFEYVNPPYALEPGVQRGHQGFLAAQANLDAAFDQFEHDPGELVDLGDRVLAWATFRARAKTGGLRYEKAEAQLWTVNHGMIIRFEWFHDRGEALEAAGLLE
jgi:ketosteroid isomerase-like protein